MKLEGTTFFLDVLIYIKTEVKNESQLLPIPSQMDEYSMIDDNHKLSVLTFDLSAINEISTVKLSNLPNNLNDESNLILILETLKLITSMESKSIEIECTTR